MKRFSEMSPEELREEMQKLQEAGQQAFAEERWSEYEIHMKKWYLAQSYLIRDQIEIHIGQTYAIREEQDQLTVAYLEGVMAWGTRKSTGQETAVPLAMLETNLTP